MTVNQYIEKSDCKVINLADSQIQISGGYAADFLSHVMAGGKENDIWFTIMSNVNVAAVAKLVGFAAVVICENIKPDDLLITKCKQQGINLFATEKPIYEACVEFSKL